MERPTSKALAYTSPPSRSFEGSSFPYAQRVSPLSIGCSTPLPQLFRSTPPQLSGVFFGSTPRWTVAASGEPIVPPTESEHLLSEATSIGCSTPFPQQSRSTPPHLSRVFFGSTTPQDDHGASGEPIVPPTESEHLSEASSIGCFHNYSVQHHRNRVEGRFL